MGPWGPGMKRLALSARPALMLCGPQGADEALWLILRGVLEYGGPPYFDTALCKGPPGGLGGPWGALGRPLPWLPILGGGVTSCWEAVVADCCLVINELRCMARLSCLLQSQHVQLQDPGAAGGAGGEGGAGGGGVEGAGGVGGWGGGESGAGGAGVKGQFFGLPLLLGALCFLAILLPLTCSSACSSTCLCSLLSGRRGELRILSCKSTMLQNSAILLAVPVAELESGGYSLPLESLVAGVVERLLLGLLLLPRDISLVDSSQYGFPGTGLGRPS